MNESAIDVRQLEKGFGGVRAVDGLSLQVRRGESVAIFGPNGAGKTTAISILLGLLTPDAGTVSVCGVEPRRAVARGCIAAMLQEGGLMPGVKVVELVGFVRSLYADPLPLDRVLETAGLASVAGRQVDRLSGGQDPAGALRARTGGQPGGLWMPLAILPGALRTIGRALPTNRLGDLGWRIAAGHAPTAASGHILVAWTAALAGLATWSYRRAGT